MKTTPLPAPDPVLTSKNTRIPPTPERLRIHRAVPPAGALRHDDVLFLQNIRAIIGRHLPDDLRVEDIAKAVFLTRVQVFRKIKALTGQSPSRFVRTVRLEMAFELLRTTRQSISDIAYSVGFVDPKYFSRVFVLEYGYPPAHFRK